MPLIPSFPDRKISLRTWRLLARIISNAQDNERGELVLLNLIRHIGQAQYVISLNCSSTDQS